MDPLDIYYRAFKTYRKETVDRAACERDRRALAQSNIDADRLEATKYLCNIEEDWIQAIEEGLEFVEKAVAEERQFIRSDGEVVPIEKVKKVSKDTVVHLAKHSDLITHIPEEGEEVVPDKLYMVEKLSDYAVYENRFLYMLLCYLRDFINFRLEKIETLRHTYAGKMTFQKEVIGKKRRLSVETRVVENREDNPFPIADEKSGAQIERIKNCQQIITSLLNTDLMTQVAKSPMIKPPITKTNVLKMNNNFKRALALYDYIASYKGTGYTYDTVRYDLTPLTETVADEIAEIANLSAFIAYQYGNGIKDLLENEYHEEQHRRKQIEAKKLEERLNRLKKRALESDKTLEEYMLVLEERNRILEKDSEELQSIRQEIDAMYRRIDALNSEKSELGRRVDVLQTTIAEKDEEIAALNQKYVEDMAATVRQHEQNVAALHVAHADETAALHAQFAEEMRGKVDAYETQVGGLQKELADWHAQYDDSVREYNQKIAHVDEREAHFDGEVQKLVDTYEAKLRDMETRYRDEQIARDKSADEALAGRDEENLYLRTELDGLRARNGLMTPSTDYTSRERFVELEAEFEAFKRFFKGQWRLTKKAIKREVYGTRGKEPTEPDHATHD